MKARTDPSERDYQPPANADERRAEYHSGSGRRPSLKTPTYNTLKGLGVAVEGRTIDLASIPLHTADGETRLDSARVEAELLRTGAHAPSLATIAVR